MIPEADAKYHDEIRELVTNHLAMRGSLGPTAFIHVEDEPEGRIVLFSVAQANGSHDIFQDVVRRMSAVLQSPRLAIASEAYTADTEDPEIQAQIHQEIMADPAILGSHPRMRHVVSIQVESDAGLTSSIHGLKRHHPEMSELVDSEPSFQPAPDWTKEKIMGFHVPSTMRESPEMAAILERTQEFKLTVADQETLKPDA